MTETPPTTGTAAGEVLSDEQLNDLLEFDVGSPRVTSLLSGHITALTTQLAASREREARLEQSLHRILREAWECNPGGELPDDHPAVLIHEWAEAALTETEEPR